MLISIQSVSKNDIKQRQKRSCSSKYVGIISKLVKKEGGRLPDLSRVNVFKRKRLDGAIFNVTQYDILMPNGSSLNHYSCEGNHQTEGSFKVMDL